MNKMWDHISIWNIFFPSVSHNTDHKNTHHGLGTIAIASGKFSNCSIQRQRVRRDKLEKWLDIKSNKRIKIVQYYNPNISALTKKVL